MADRAAAQVAADLAVAAPAVATGRMVRSSFLATSRRVEGLIRREPHDKHAELLRQRCSNRAAA